MRAGFTGDIRPPRLNRGVGRTSHGGGALSIWVPSRRVRLGCILPVAFVSSCVCLIQPAARLADPMTHSPVDDDRSHSPFPVVAVTGDGAWVNMVEDPHNVPPPPTGATYLIPLERARSIERYLREHDTVHRKSSWVLRVKALSSDRQRVELFLLGDGYWGGVYDATSTSITPQYRKIAGPGFGFVFGPLALLLNSALWGIAIAGVWAFRHRRSAAQRFKAFCRAQPR